ncbi:hypothetical protein Pfo_023749 [Paulownia fortunei]|nr:hypothetical protein Pfo_023749 [Paulownia fortunei]
MFGSVSITWARNLGHGRKLRKRGEGIRRGKGAAWVRNEGLEIQVGSQSQKGIRRWTDAAVQENSQACTLDYQRGLVGVLEEERSDQPIRKGKKTSSKELSVKPNFKVRAFSASAKEKLEAAGCSLTILPGRRKWVKPSVAKNIACAEEYFAKKRATSESADSPST